MTCSVGLWRGAGVLVGVLAIGASTHRTVNAAGGHTLIEAARASDLQGLRAALRHADVNAAEPDGTTALHWAAYNDNTVAIEVLLAAGAKPEVSNQYGETPLNLACVNGNAGIVERLLESGANPNTRLRDGSTALMTAARTGRAEALRALVRHGANVNATEPVRHQTALMWAAHANNAAAVKILIEGGADVNARTVIPPPRDDPEFTYMDFRSKHSFSSPPPGGFSALVLAARAGSLDAVRALLDAGADVDAAVSDGRSALILACANARWEVADLLVDRGANPNDMRAGWAPLHQIARTRRLNMGQGLPAPKPMGRVDSLDLVRHLVRRGAQVNARMTRNGMRDGQQNRLDRFGATPFLLAAKTVDTEMMRTLIELGANPFIPNVEHTTPLMVAAGLKIYQPGQDAGTLPGSEVEALAAVRMLVEEYGADVNQANDFGDTALHGAAYRGADNVAQYLVDRGARLDARNDRGWTPLTIAQGVFYADFLHHQAKLAAVLRQLMQERGLSTEGQDADPAACDECLSTVKRHADAAYERDRRHEAEYKANPNVLDWPGAAR